jgi:predicted RNA-binding protein YlxR (DUF448 family)
LKKASLKKWKKNPLTKQKGKKITNSAVITERTCIACGKTADKSVFLRFVTDGCGKVIYDRKGKLPGRGLYLCSEKDCSTAACRKNLFSKGFKEKIDKKEFTELSAEISEITLDYAFALLRAGTGAGLVSGGSAKCEKLLGSSQAKLLLIPEDASEDTVKKILILAEARGVAVKALPDKYSVATELGVPLRAAFVVTDEKLAEAVSCQLEFADRIKSWLNGV